MIKSIGKANILALAILAIFCAMPVAAYPAPAPATTQAQANPPGRVARLDFFSGTVTIQPAGAQTWSHAELNWPLTTGDRLWTGNRGRAELQIGSSALRLDRNTAFDIVDLDDRTLQVKVTQGSLTARFHTLAPGQDVEVDTPNLALQATNPGSYRVDVAPNGDATTVTVRSGSATLYGDHATLAILAGQQIRFIGTQLQQYTGTTEPMLDGFDAWTTQRDANANNAISAQYVSSDMTGYQDLDANGTWQTTQSYGAVWIPTVAMYSGWAPYSEGHWAWIAPWGWNWIDAEPWGFAPFHYGRWAQFGGLWGWVPGAYARIWSPVYAPALVGFVGGAQMSWGINMPFGGGMGPGIAWLPLGPGENWYPAYGVSRGYFNRVNNINGNIVRNTTIVNQNIFNNRNKRNYYLNRNIPGAITAVPAKIFMSGRAVAKAAIPLSRRQIARATIVAAAPALAPVRASFLGGMRPTGVGQPRHAMQRQVIATRAPVIPPAYRDSLAQRYAAHGGLMAGAGKPVVHDAVRGTAVSAGSPMHSDRSTLLQTFHVINPVRTQQYDVRSLPAGHNGNHRLNAVIPTVREFPGSNNPAIRQDRFATPGYADHSSSGAIHDFQVLHLPPQPTQDALIQSGHRDAGRSKPYDNASGLHPYANSRRSPEVVSVPVPQQHRAMQGGNYGQPSYFGNERSNQRRLASPMQSTPRVMPQAMPAQVRAVQPAAVQYQRPAPRPRATVYPRIP